MGCNRLGPERVRLDGTLTIYHASYLSEPRFTFVLLASPEALSARSKRDLNWLKLQCSCWIVICRIKTLKLAVRLYEEWGTYVHTARRPLLLKNLISHGLVYDTSNRPVYYGSDRFIESRKKMVDRYSITQANRSRIKEDCPCIG